MFVYYSKTFTSSSVAARYVGVQCEKCKCEYYFELARIGSGKATAHYGIGQVSAVDSARSSSDSDAQKRLAVEAELVPCPRCQWINEELIAGYRSGKYRHWGTNAIFATIVGVAVSWIAAWSYYSSPPWNENVFRVFLIYVPLVIVAFGASVFALRALLRSRIQPNRDFPFPPKLMPGVPPALYLNAESGELMVAATNRNAEMATDSVEIQIGRNQLPSVCCVCLGPADPDSAISHTIAEAVNVHVPHCKKCASQISSKTIYLGIGVAATIVGITYTILWLVNTSTEVFLLGLCVSPLVGFILGAYLSNRMYSSAFVRVLDSSRGVVKIRFRNPGYVRIVSDGSVVMTAPDASGGPTHPSAETKFDVVLTSFGKSMLDVVKVVKNLTGASLLDVKKMVEAPPSTIKRGVSEYEAKKVKAELEAAGATVELK